MTTRSSPTPKPPCGGAPYLKDDEHKPFNIHKCHATTKFHSLLSQWIWNMLGISNKEPNFTFLSINKWGSLFSESQTWMSLYMMILFSHRFHMPQHEKSEVQVNVPFEPLKLSPHLENIKHVNTQMQTVLSIDANLWKTQIFISSFFFGCLLEWDKHARKAIGIIKLTKRWMSSQDLEVRGIHQPYIVQLIKYDIIFQTSYCHSAKYATSKNKWPWTAILSRHNKMASHLEWRHQRSYCKQDHQDMAWCRMALLPEDTGEVCKIQYHICFPNQKNKENVMTTFLAPSQLKKYNSYLSKTSLPSFLSASVFRSPNGSTSNPAACLYK